MPLRTVALLAPWVDARGVARSLAGSIGREGQLYVTGTRLQLPHDLAKQIEAQRRAVWAPSPATSAPQQEKHDDQPAAAPEPATEDAAKDLDTDPDTDQNADDAGDSSEGQPPPENAEQTGEATNEPRHEVAGDTVSSGPNLNTDTANDLQKAIKGVGKATASDIVAHRKKGAFESLADCADRVGGVSVAQLEAAGAIV